MAPTYLEMVRGNTVRAWTGHRSVPPVTMTNIRSFVFTMVVITYVPRRGKRQYRTCLDRSQVSTTCDRDYKG